MSASHIDSISQAKKISDQKNRPTAEEVRFQIDQLEYGNDLEKDFSHDLFFKPFIGQHHNTYLLQALAWNRIEAALKLIELDKTKKSLSLKDDFPTCKNTPLILAAKIDATKVLIKLIEAGVDVNEKDYRGFTALHYACLLRNEIAIKHLIGAKSDLQAIDAFGKKPYDYYYMTINADDLSYAYGETNITNWKEEPYAGLIYGETNTKLNIKWDNNNHYFATKKKCLSAFRWYVTHIIINNKLGHSLSVGYQLFLIPEIATDKIIAQLSSIEQPVLLRKFDGNYYLWGRKNGNWQITEFNKAELKEVEKWNWNFSNTQQIAYNSHVFNILKNGHTLSSLYEHASYLLANRKPISDAGFYHSMLQCCLNNRPKLNEEIRKRLYPFKNSYKVDTTEYELDIADLIPIETILSRTEAFTRVGESIGDSERWIELQEFKKPSFGY